MEDIRRERDYLAVIRSREGSIRWLLRWVRPYYAELSAGVGAVTAASFISTLDPLLLRQLIDHSLPAKDGRACLFYVSLMGLFYLLRAVLNATGQLVNCSVCVKSARDLRAAIYKHLTSLSPDYQESVSTGEKLTLIEHDAWEISALGEEAANTSLRTVIFMLLNVLMMLRLSMVLTCVIIPVLLSFSVIRKRFRRSLYMLANTVRDRLDTITNILTEDLSAVPQLQLLRRETEAFTRIDHAWARLIGAYWAQRKLDARFSTVLMTLSALAVVLVLGGGSLQTIYAKMSIGSLVAYYTYTSRLFEPLSALMDLYGRAQRTGANVDKVREFLAVQPSICDGGAHEVVCSNEGLRIRFANVTVEYQKRQVLANVSCEIKHAEHIAIVGKSGSGKSTIAKLLPRMLEPASGELLLGNRPLGAYKLSALRKAVCYLPQNPVIFGATIRENILLSRPDASADEIDEVVALTELNTIAARLPKGIHTELPSNGLTLSGGERQRIVIARGLLSGAPIMICDECTSALDAPAEKALLRRIASKYAGRTLVVISHRVASLLWADRIIVVGGGGICHVGSHNSLLEESAVYKSLFNASLS